MGKFDQYKVVLKGVQPDVQNKEYLLDNQFFANIGEEFIQKGKVNVSLKITNTNGIFTFEFHSVGHVVIPCDRCLDDMNYPLDTQSRLIVKLGKDYSEESDEIVVIPELEGVINIAWFLYEFVALAIPIKHVHAPGKCNKQMSQKLKQHSTKKDDEDEDFFESTDDVIITDEDFEDQTDPRWDALKGLKDKKDNNNE